LKTMAIARMSQKILAMLFQTLVLSVIEYGFGLLTLSKSHLNRLEVIQNEAMRAILGCTRDTSAEAMRYILGFPTMAERHKLAQVKAFLKVSADENHPLHQKVGNRPPSRLKRGSEWMTQASNTVENCVSVNSVYCLLMVQLREGRNQAGHSLSDAEVRLWEKGQVQL
ncbi:MAG: hypothetical protein GY777_10630, partial [Candidatus Brocadiaceae bacterium]|nr:hypothetical protein [Candidatus Brocadiaceae bacterium]